MFLNRKDVEKIQEILEKFSDVETFEIEQTGNNGIGTITTMIFDYEVNGMRGNFKIEISGVEDW